VSHAAYFHQLLEAEFCTSDGEPWPCLNTRQRAVCACSHQQRAHGVDRKDRPTCLGSVTCACTTFRLKEDQ
jgi:hypothetical protein